MLLPLVVSHKTNIIFFIFQIPDKRSFFFSRHFKLLQSFYFHSIVLNRCFNYVYYVLQLFLFFITPSRIFLLLLAQCLLLPLQFSSVTNYFFLDIIYVVHLLNVQKLLLGNRGKIDTCICSF